MGERPLATLLRRGPRARVAPVASENRRDPAQLDERDTERALRTIADRDLDRAADARHILNALTWGEGLHRLTQAAVQDWLWYRLPTRYLTDEEGFAASMAEIAAELFDELGLDRYAELCRSETTAAVHAAFERDDQEGFVALREARARSGIDVPDLEDFEWSHLMGVEEAAARAAVESALEAALAAGELVVGAPRWRIRQREIVARVLDTEHPDQLGQTWRTAVVTERLAGWVDQSARVLPEFAAWRASVANRLLHAIPPPPDVADRVAPITWLLTEWGESQKLTQAGNLNTAFVRHVAANPAWAASVWSTTNPRSENEQYWLQDVRVLLTRTGMLRRRGRELRRTAAGAALAVSAEGAWSWLTHAAVGDPWDAFVFEAHALALLAGESLTDDERFDAVAGIGAALGWRTVDQYGDYDDPDRADVARALRTPEMLFELCGLVARHEDHRDPRWALSAAGYSALHAILRDRATGPRRDVR